MLTISLAHLIIENSKKFKIILIPKRKNQIRNYKIKEQKLQKFINNY